MPTLTGMPAGDSPILSTLIVGLVIVAEAAPVHDRAVEAR
jgi:hypothetical protein